MIAGNGSVIGFNQGELRWQSMILERPSEI